MPLIPDSVKGAPDTTQLGVTGPVTSPLLPPLPTEEGTGAGGPKYSALDTWAAAARTTVVGRAEENVQQMRAAGYNPLSPSPAVDTEGMIPKEMLPWKDKYVDVYTPEEVAYRTAQIKSTFNDQAAMGASKWGGLAAIALGVSDPVGVASMALPIAAETRLANMIRLGLVGGGVSAVDESILHAMDPLATYQGSLVNIGAGTLLSGLLGGLIKPHVPASDFERLRAHLQQDFEAPVHPGPEAPHDSTTQIAADIRAAAERHAETLRATAEAQGAATAGARAEVEARLTAAQERLRAAGEPLTPEARATAVTQEAERLAPAGGTKEAPLETTPAERESIQARAEAAIDAANQTREIERADAQRSIEAAQEDRDRLQRSQEAFAEYERFHAVPKPAEPQAPGPRALAEPTGYHVAEGELTDELRQRFQGLRSEVRPRETPGAAGAGKSTKPVSGGQAGGGARGAEGVSGRGGEPLTLYRGGRGGPLSPEHFAPESFGKASGRPSAGLGVFFTNDAAHAANFGQVTTHHLDIRNPLILKTEELPEFESIEAATKWRQAQEALGHDGLIIDASHLGGATYYVPFKFEQALRPAAPAQPDAAGQRTADVSTTDMERVQRVAKALTPTLKRAAGDEVLGQQLKDMAARKSGWYQAGGGITRNERGDVNGRLPWIPNAEWWPGRPGGYNTAEVQRIVDKALAGERLGPKQQQLIEHMTEVADARVAHEPYLPTAEELKAQGLSEASADDAYETAMITRLRLIDEGALENLARQFENDDNGFLREVKKVLDAHDTDARLARSVTQEREPHGDSPDRTRAERAPRPPGGAGETPSIAGREPARTGGAGAERERAGESPSADALAAQARQDIDINELLRRLPARERAHFEDRLTALEKAPSAPIVASPTGESTAGAQAFGDFLGMKDYRLARGGRVLGKALGWFAPGSRVLRSPSLAVRRAALDLVETPEMLELNVPTKERPFGLPTPTAVETLLKRWEGRWAEGFAARAEQYRAYRERPPAAGEPAKFGKHQFNQEVSAAMRRGDEHPIPEVSHAARATRKLVFNPLKEEAQRLGLLPMQEDMLRGTAESYLMREYDRAKIRADRAGWHQLLRDGFIEQGVESAEADDIAHKVTRNLLGSEMGLLDMNDVVFRGVVPTSGRLKERQILLPDTTLEKYLNGDIDHLSHSYLKSLAPQVEVTKRFGDKDLQGLFKDVTDEYSIMVQRALAKGDNDGANALNDRMRADLRDVAAMRDRMYGIFGVPSDPTGWLQRAGRVIRSVNAFRLLGTATWSHLPDMANVVMRHGLGNTLAAATKLSSSLEALKLNRTELHRVGSALDMIHNSTAAQLGEFGVDSQYAVQKALNRGTRAFTIATLEIPWIAVCKSLAGAVAHDEILEAAQRQEAGQLLGQNERIRLNQMGMGVAQLKRAHEQFVQHGQTVNGLRFGMTDKWSDAGAAQALDAAVGKAAEASTLQPSKGDTPLWTSSEVGKAIFQFKTFGAVAIRKVVIPLAQGIAHADLRSAQGLATLIAAGAATYTMKQLLSGQPIEKDPKRYGLEVLDKSNLLGWVGEFFYPVLWQMGMQSFSRWGDRQSWETLAGPVAGTAVDAFDLRIPAKLRGQFSSTYNPGEAHFNRGDIHRIRRMLPANQIWYLRQAVNHLESHIGDEMGLPPEAPRGSTE